MSQEAKSSVKKAPALVHEEPDIVIQSARDLFNEDVAEIVIDDRDEYLRLKEFLSLFLPERANDVRIGIQHRLCEREVVPDFSILRDDDCHRHSCCSYRSLGVDLWDGRGIFRRPK